MTGGDEVTKDEMTGDEVTKDEMTGDEVTKDEMTGNEVTRNYIYKSSNFNFSVVIGLEKALTLTALDQ
ncbi:hemocyanin-like 1 (Hcl-1) [Biomphalaria glabrata]